MTTTMGTIAIMAMTMISVGGATIRDKHRPPVLVSLLHPLSVIKPAIPPTSNLRYSPYHIEVFKHTNYPGEKVQKAGPIHRDPALILQSVQNVQEPVEGDQCDAVAGTDGGRNNQACNRYKS